jgi:DNA-directed RNA polymerase subunit M/transcription elongation factor TFIIS
MSTVIEFYVPDKDRKFTVRTLSEHFSEYHSKKIEKGYYDFTKQYCHGNQHNTILAASIYKDKVKDLIFNCQKNNKTMKEIKKQISRNMYNAYNLAFLRPDELDENNWMKIILRMKTTNEKLNNLPAIEWEPCRQCKCIEHYFYQLQTRSADEPMTTFYICKSCGKTTSINN